MAILLARMIVEYSPKGKSPAKVADRPTLTLLNSSVIYPLYFQRMLLHLKSNKKVFCPSLNSILSRCVQELIVRTFTVCSDAFQIDYARLSDQEKYIFIVLLQFTCRYYQKIECAQTLCTKFSSSDHTPACNSYLQCGNIGLAYS